MLPLRIPADGCARLAGREGCRVNRRVRGRYCETLREAGTLLVVFASLDASFELGRASAWTLAMWNVIGISILMLGIHLEPKV